MLWEKSMKRIYLILTLPIIVGLGAFEKSVPTEKELTHKIDYLCKKFSHLNELVCLYESIAQDIALLVHTKYEINNVIIQHWLVENNLIRICKQKMDYDNLDTDSLNEKLDRIVIHAFKRLLVPQFAYLRTYIKLQNQLVLNDAH